MLKFYIQPDKKYKGQTYRSRKIIADEKYLERLLKVPEAIVYSSWRSLAEQKVLVAQGKSKTLQSNHRRGMACDVINWSEVQEKMLKVGLINDISWDKNHYAYDGESKAAKYPIYDTLPVKLEEYKTPPSTPIDNKHPSIDNSTLQQTPQNLPAVEAVSQSVVPNVLPSVNANSDAIVTPVATSVIDKVAQVIAEEGKPTWRDRLMAFIEKIINIIINANK